MNRIDAEGLEEALNRDGKIGVRLNALETFFLKSMVDSYNSSAGQSAMLFKLSLVIRGIFLNIISSIFFRQSLECYDFYILNRDRVVVELKESGDFIFYLIDQ